ncbi:hypothetical protein [Streptomyces rapamycinicus]|uniref:Membrane protein n=2 Tax=Streptomyces rapamycinicus TaxID=1226757 RepID=A0A0A0NDU8_STRRN|nr:hypothetical protein [Streptomyces rapamycinicus]AGP55386.1 membrane protein [Streptomyces rapamycinicus NRRL 5491]MBB4782941.1 hypothetical protein [Streptomyces rapamycinicus]RLV81579.1 membrane protein [Streptomyces rapamycinicus NRRL 5491]UTO63401.1 hypothetical protein LJB45_14410 [Streptomyces rapamycinicus]UTP31358.1 hypothetical protein LIV37_19525 [Streptomyces rapamycinicus NRRL 5491]
MELLIFLIAIVMIGGLIVLPAVRRMRGGRGAVRGAMRASDPQEYGFVPRERLDVRLPGPDRQLIDALEEVQARQDWQPAARLLALTEATSELRWQRVQTLAGAAAFELAQAPGQGGMWLRTWRVAAPEDPGAAAVHAEFLVRQALLDPSSQDFRMILEEARDVCHEAARLAPEDPVPHIVELGVARGLAYRQADFEELWTKVTKLAPHHMGAHLAALHYWCEKWHGSQDRADAFTHAAAASAPAKSLLPALPLFGVFEHLPEANLVRTLYRSEVITKAMEGALYAVRQAPADHPVLPHVRHLLVFFLVRAERYAEALEQLRHVDGHVGAVPWSYGVDPAAEYTVYRALAVAGWEGGGGTPATLPQ